MGRNCAAVGGRWRKNGKSWVHMPLCVQVRTAATFAFALSRIRMRRDGVRRNFSGEIARKSRKFQQNSIFRRKSGGIEVELRCGGRVVARRNGKSWTLLPLCAQVRTAATFAFALCCVRVGWDGARRNFSGEIARKAENFGKTGIFGGIRRDWGEMYRDGRVVAQRNGKLRARLSFRVRACVATVVFCAAIRSGWATARRCGKLWA